VLTITLDRPDRLNAFTVEMWREVRELGEELRDDPVLRALVVIGEGRAFSSGIDTSVFAGPLGDDLGAGPDAGTRDEDPVIDSIMRTQDSFTWLEEAPYATIAAVRGYALGAGLQLALACDLRVIAEGTKVGLLEFKYGILPDLGGTQRLPRLVGAAKAKELIFTATQIDADEALRIGLVERLVPDTELEPTVRDLAATIAAQPPLAVQGAKRAVNVAGTMPTRDGLRVEAEGQAVCLRSDDMKEAIAAFVERRTPDYQRR
jgi:enoyl-CoA hydratase/carnithine racemase